MSTIAEAREKKRPAPLIRVRTSSSDAASLAPPRTPRFAEATTVHSPLDHGEPSPFADPPAHNPTKSNMARSQPADVGFGYISQNLAENNDQSIPANVPLAPGSPLKSAMKLPGQAKKGMPGTPGLTNPLSPTFREEQVLEKHEEWTEKEQAKDLVVKTRVRIAKIVLRMTNFSCSLIVLAMISTTMHIFLATHNLPAQNSLPAWANGTKTWPQYTILVISCISLAFCLTIFWNYWRGGHKRAEKTAVYYTLFAVGFFVFSIVMWAIAAGILQGTKSNSGNQDIWGWSCVDNKRRELFQDKVDYALVCRLQSWSLICCIIEVVVETLTILIYGIVFYRYYSKRKLRKSMDVRDRARSDLYLAQLRSQSAPNTPGFGPLSPSYSTYSMALKSPRVQDSGFQHLSDIEAASGTVPPQEPTTRFVDASKAVVIPRPFELQAPPTKPMPKLASHGVAGETKQEQEQHMNIQSSPPRGYAKPGVGGAVKAMPLAEGEIVYESVPIPGAYGGAVRR